MKPKLSLLLAAAGVVAFAASLTYRYYLSAPEPEATVPVYEPPAAQTVVEEETPAGMDILTHELGEDLPPDLADDLAEADFEDLFDDEPDPTVADNLLVIEQGDSTRYVTEQDRRDSARRQQRAREESLNASAYVGDDRLQMMGVLGTYAGEGNTEAVAELRRVLQSDDEELRADALDAIAELLPGSDAVPPFSEKPPSDSQVERLIEALQDQERS